MQYARKSQFIINLGMDTIFKANKFPYDNKEKCKSNLKIDS